MRFAVLVLCTQAYAATVTVCASGCDYTSAQTAINAAADDSSIDVVELRAGETFTGSIYLPRRTVSKHRVTIRSSRHQELPLRGTRVSFSSHSSKMPKLTGGDTANSVISAYPPGAWFTASASTDVITLNAGYYTAVPDGTRLVVAARSGESLPEPLSEGVVYYARDSSTNTLKLAATSGGAAIDLTTDGSAGNVLNLSSMDPPANYTFDGVWIQSAYTGASILYNLVDLGGNVIAPGANVTGIEFRRCIIRGDPDRPDVNVRNGILFSGGSLLVEDSVLDHFHEEGGESHALAPVFADGLVIRNNFLSAASLGLLTGGSGIALNNSYPVSNLILTGNHIYKHGYYLYHQGSAAPTNEPCFPGMFFRNTAPSPNTCANGACYVCQANGTWAQDTGAVYRNYNLLTKSAVEYKGCSVCAATGNVIENTFDAHDTGNTSCISAITGQAYQQTLDISVENNLCKNTFTGIAAATTDPANLGKRILIRNNVLTGQGECDKSINPGGTTCGDGAHTWALRVDGGRNDVRVLNNTARDPELSARRNMELAFNAPGIIDPLLIANNMVAEAVYPLFVDGTDGTCGTGGLGRYMNLPGAPYPIRNNVIFGTRSDYPPYTACITNVAWPASVSFVSTTNHRLVSGGPYSADCVSDCQFTGTDGKDIGADIDEWEDYTSGVIAGVQPWSVQAGLKVWVDSTLQNNPAAFQLGSTRAAIQFRRVAGGTCSVKLYTNASRTTLHGDTDVSGEQACDRAGNLASPSSVTAVFGGNTALTAATTYYYRIDDGTRVMVGSFMTKAAGSASAQYTLQWPTSRTLDYSTNADMSGSTTMGSASSHTVTVSQGSVLYVQPAGGRIMALVAP